MIQDNKYYQKLINSTNLPLLQFCKLVNQLLIDYNKLPFTKTDIVQMFLEAYDNWIYQEYMNDEAAAIIKPYLKALNNVVDEQILNSIVNSILNNLHYDELGNEFLVLFNDKLISKLNDPDIVKLTLHTVDASYFAKLIREYKLDSFTDEINNLIDLLIGDDSTKAKRPLNPNDFQYLSDDQDPINNTLTSTIKPIEFNNYRSEGIVVLDDLVLHDDKEHTEIINDRREYCMQHKVKGYNPNGKNILEEFGISTLAVGSSFGTAVLLEYVTNSTVDRIDPSGSVSASNGDVNRISKALKRKGYSKVYLQKGTPYLSRKYVRKAKKQI